MPATKNSHKSPSAVMVAERSHGAGNGSGSAPETSGTSHAPPVFEQHETLRALQSGADQAHDGLRRRVDSVDSPLDCPSEDPSVQLAWVQAFVETQRQTAECHAEFQRAMAASHGAFLRSSEASLAALVALQRGDTRSPPSEARPAPQSGFAEHRAPHAAPTQSMPRAPALNGTATHTGENGVDVSANSGATNGQPAPAPWRSALRQPPPPSTQHTPVVGPVPTVRSSAATALSVEQTEALALGVVASCTGYPQEMLGLDMDLETDLGVDSIKRVEILAALRKREPSLPEVGAAQLASKRTLRQIISFFQEASLLSAGEGDAPGRGIEPVAAVAVGNMRVLSLESMEALALGVVASCTGYPQEMLGLDMDLETDLGVDSIKRVEILAALRKREPSLPEVGAAQLAPQRTLRQIISFFLTTSSTAIGEPSLPSAIGQPKEPIGPDLGQSPVREMSSQVCTPEPDRLVVRVMRASAPGLGTPGLFQPEGLFVTDDGLGVAIELVTLLAANGADAKLVSEVPPSATSVIFLGGLRAVANPGDQIEINREAFRAFRTVAATFGSRGGTFVTVQDTGSDFGISGSERAWLGGMPALAKTAAIEWPKACVRSLDIERGERSAADIAEAIWEELRTGGDDPEVGLARDGRLVPTTQPAPLDHTPGASPLPLTPSSVVVATGGARGVTSACIVALAKAARCRFVLVGRTELVDEPVAARGIYNDGDLKRALLVDARGRGLTLRPADLGREAARIYAMREIRKTIEAIRDAGGEVRYDAVDTTDGAKVAALLTEVRTKWGPISGIVHGAGLLADKPIADQTEEQFDLVFGTKVLGLRALLDAAATDRLSLMFLFSSVVARAGNTGQGAYAIANEVLNKVAALEQRRRGSECVVRAIGFGPWDGGMVDDGLRAHFSARGVALIPLASGAEQLRRELSAPASRDAEIIVGFGNFAAATRDEKSLLERELFVDRRAYPFLDGHRIEGTPVVPVTLVVEWFARAVRSWWPDVTTARFYDLHVQRGIRLPRFDEGGVERFSLRARSVRGAPTTSVSLELFGADGARHYVASVETAGKTPVALAPLPSQLVAGPSGPLYRARSLFHGPSFEVIDRIEETTTTGMTAWLVGTKDRAWPGEWRLDPALLDGGLQLALLWSRHLSARASLPTSIGGIQVHVAGLLPERVRCVLRGRAADELRVVTDLAFTDATGGPVADLHEVVTHLLPHKPQALGE